MKERTEERQHRVAFTPRPRARSDSRAREQHPAAPSSSTTRSAHARRHHDGYRNRDRPLRPPAPSESSVSEHNSIDAALAEAKVDRSWYNAEEGTMLSADADPFADYVALYEDAVVELSSARSASFTTQAHSRSSDRLNDSASAVKCRVRHSLRATESLRDSELWIENRLHKSGVTQRVSSFSAAESESLERPHVIVRNEAPDFIHAFLHKNDAAHTLDGATGCCSDSASERSALQFTADPAATIAASIDLKIIKDPTGDLARFARNGSAAVAHMRSERDRRRVTVQRTQVAGTTLGNVMGIKATDAVSSADLATLEQEPTITNSAQAKYSDNMNQQHVTAPKQSVADVRRSLPVFASRANLLQLIRENQALIVVGETGSGKTTQLAQYLYETGYAKNGVIACTQPRRVAAMSVAKRVAEEVGCTLGSIVGYTIRFEDCTSNATKIKYMTDGILLRELLHDPDVEKYSCVIMDEAHERSLNTDVLMGILKRVLSRRSDLKLIVTSATMDSEKFSAFYGNAPVYKIPGRTFPVDVLYSKGACEDYVEAAVRQAVTVHLTLPPGDMLIFMTGQEDVEATCTILQTRLDKLASPAPPLEILPIYSQLPADLQNKIFEKRHTAEQRAEGSSSKTLQVRRCIVATNIAETSLTIDGIVYVIDTGFCKLKFYNAKIGMDALQVMPISRAQANQRSGRAGRCAPGVAYRMYTECAFRNEMHIATIPEIQRTNLANVMLLLKSVGVSDLLSFDFMDAPPRGVVLAAMYQLWVLGALDTSGNLTELGDRMVAYPLDPPLSKMLIASQVLGCSAEMVTIVSMLSVPTVFVRPKEGAEEADAARERFMVPESDHLTLLNVYQQWRTHALGGDPDALCSPATARAEYAWCSENYIQPRAMRRANEVRRQLVDIMHSAASRSGNNDAKLVSCGGNWDVLRLCICAAYLHHAAQLRALSHAIPGASSSTSTGAEYANMRTGLTCGVHPTSALYGMGHTPDYIVYHELMMTSKQYAHCVTAVEPVWLAELGPRFFTIASRHAAIAKSTASASLTEHVRSVLAYLSQPKAKPLPDPTSTPQQQQQQQQQQNNQNSALPTLSHNRNNNNSSSSKSGIRQKKSSTSTVVMVGKTPIRRRPR